MKMSTTANAASTARSVGNISLTLKPGDRDRIKFLAVVKKRTPHFLMKEAIQRYLHDEEEELRFAAAANASWDDFKKTGLHITFDEARSWAKKLKKDPSAKLAECHK